MKGIRNTWGDMTMTRGSLDRGQNARKNKVTKKLRPRAPPELRKKAGKLRKSYEKVTSVARGRTGGKQKLSKSYEKVTKVIQNLRKKVTKVMKTLHFGHGREAAMPKIARIL